VSQASKGELVVKSVATAVVATIIVEAGLSISKTLTKQPVILFGLGLLTGYMTHKYRKEIIILSSHTAEQSKDFIVQQKNHLREFLAEADSSNNTEQKDQGN
jgi:hypothetical protein